MNLIIFCLLLDMFISTSLLCWQLTILLRMCRKGTKYVDVQQPQFEIIFTGYFEVQSAPNAYQSLRLRNNFAWVSRTPQSEFGRRSYGRFTKTAQCSDIAGDPPGSHANEPGDPPAKHEKNAVSSWRLASFDAHPIWRPASFVGQLISGPKSTLGIYMPRKRLQTQLTRLQPQKYYFFTQEEEKNEQRTSIHRKIEDETSNPPNPILGVSTFSFILVRTMFLNISFTVVLNMSS